MTGLGLRTYGACDYGSADGFGGEEGTRGFLSSGGAGGGPLLPAPFLVPGGGGPFFAIGAGAGRVIDSGAYSGWDGAGGGLISSGWGYSAGGGGGASS